MSVRGCAIDEQRTENEADLAVAHVMRRLIDGRLGPWRLESVLGKGASGLVFRALADDGTPRAVKVLRKTDEAVPRVLERFAREATILQKLHVPGIIQVDGPMQSDGDDLMFFAMELLEGSDLDQHLSRAGPMALAVAIDLCLEVLQPLEAAHRAGIVHRDIKPANIFLLDRPSKGSSIRLLDFGLAKEGVALHKPTAQSGTDLMMGTPAFMAPEQILGEAVSDATDLFGVASVLYLMLTGRRPWEGGAGLELFVKKLQEPPPLLRVLRPDAPERLEALLFKAMSLRMDQRPHSAAAFASALRAVRGDLSGISRSTQPEMPRPSIPPTTQPDAEYEPPAESRMLVAVPSGPELPTVPSLDALPHRWPFKVGVALTLSFLVCALLWALARAH